jgi:hypothetical protein
MIYPHNPGQFPAIEKAILLGAWLLLPDVWLPPPPLDWPSFLDPPTQPSLQPRPIGPWLSRLSMAPWSGRIDKSTRQCIDGSMAKRLAQWPRSHRQHANTKSQDNVVHDVVVIDESPRSET